MRNGFLALVMVAMGASVASAQDWAEKMFVKGNAPHRTHDFGSVARGTQLYRAFPVTNLYAVPIEIIGIRSS
jgi:hypothetical protein